MIVKNESHVIKDTLTNLCSYFPFSYWVICDTGSTDGTQDIIRDFFGEKGISGELLEHEWRDFGHNRSLALSAAYNKTDYLLVFDADDRIIGDFKLPSEMTADSYYLKIGKEFSYKRTLIVNNHKKWCFKGVLHEFIMCLEESSPSVDITGDYYMQSSRSGSRNADPLKYSKDAAILEKACECETDTGLRNRYVFYCAQSYKDAGNIEKAIEWYEKVLELNTWDQEKYISYLRLGECFKQIGDEATMVYYWTKGYSFMPSRVETLYQLINHYRHKGEHRLCEMYYNVAKNIRNPGTNALFNSNDVYEYKLDEEYTIFSYYVGNRNIDEHMRRMVADGRANMGLLMSNSQFYSENKLKLIKDANGAFKLIDNVFSFSSKEERTALYKTSKNILFFTGYSDRDWNHTYAKSHSLGGSEKAVSYLSKCFPQEYTIYVAGGLEPEVVDNVIYVNNDNLAELLSTTQFHTIICSRYVGFLEKYADIFKFYQFYLWAHDTCLIRTDTNFTIDQVLEKWDKHIDGCVCLTNWHADRFKNLYPTLKNKIHIINNGIVPELFAGVGVEEKIKNRFIYSSRSERGLERLIELWPSILERKQDATLVVFGYKKFPSSELDNKIATEMLKYKDSITHIGQLNASQMYEQMRMAEYWLYPTNWDETSCITALEMLASGVICLYYPLAGLVDTMNKYGIQITHGNEVDTLCSLSEERKTKMLIKGREYAFSCSWKNRAETWCNIIGLVKYDFHIPIKIINLERRPDRKESMIKEFEKQGIILKEENFVKAVDGKELKLTEELYELFKGNNFNYRPGVIGCALSHYYLWKQLIDDETTDYYVIMEDDCVLDSKFKNGLNEYKLKLTEKKSPTICFIGYVQKQKSIDCQRVSAVNLNKNNFFCGSFGYIINKSAAKKFVLNANEHRFKYAIDGVLMVYMWTGDVDWYELSPLIVHSDIAVSPAASDIQYDYNSIKLDQAFIDNHFVFYEHCDQCDNDKYCKLDNINKMLLTALNDTSIVAVNTYGWFKNNIVNLTKPSWYNKKGQGIYIKREHEHLVSNPIENNGLTMAYLNFWPQSYNHTQDWWLSEFIKQNISHEYVLISPNNEPDILITSCFGNIENVKQIKSKCKIFFYGENLNLVPPYNNHELLKNTFDIILGFKDTNLNEKLVRLPLWMLYYPFYKFDETNNIINHIQNSYDNNTIRTDKLNAASLIASHDRNGIRTFIYNEVKNTIDVLCPGTLLRNVEPIGPTCEDKLKFISKTRFNICPENSEGEGYFTEKIFHSLESGCIPFYWAIDKPEQKILNEECYCWIDKNNPKETKERILDTINNYQRFYNNKLFKDTASGEIKLMYDTLKDEIVKYVGTQFITINKPIKL